MGKREKREEGNEESEERGRGKRGDGSEKMEIKGGKDSHRIEGEEGKAKLERGL